MGQQLSRVYGTIIKRPTQRYNVENRAQAVISKIKDQSAPAMRAPMYKSDKDVLEENRSLNPRLQEEVHSRDRDLYQRLKSVYVTSDETDLQGNQRAYNPERPLPLDRVQHYYDFVPASLRTEPGRKAPRGKISLSEAVKIISEHSANPEQNTPASIAEKYRLNPDLVRPSLQYFKLYKVHTPRDKAEMERFDPLKAGKDWVEDFSGNLGKISGVEAIKAREAELKRLHDLQEKRIESQKTRLLLDQEKKT